MGVQIRCNIFFIMLCIFFRITICAAGGGKSACLSMATTDRYIFDFCRTENISTQAFSRRGARIRRMCGRDPRSVRPFERNMELWWLCCRFVMCVGLVGIFRHQSTLRRCSERDHGWCVRSRRSGRATDPSHDGKHRFSHDLPVDIGDVARRGTHRIGIFFAWDYATKHGRLSTIGALSYLSPLFSTLLLIAAGWTAPHWAIVVATLLIVVGAVIATLDRKRFPFGQANRNGV